MSASDRIEATAKNVEGKIQEAIGKATGDSSTEVKGKAKQVEAGAEHAKEDVKDAVKDTADAVKDTVD